jgi:non-specific serine/threonine protein kinase
VSHQQAAAAVDNLDQIWLMGGLTGNGQSATTDVERYEPRTDVWTQGPQLREAVNHAMAVNYNGHIIMMGGFLGDSASTTAQVTDHVWELQPDGWRRLPDLPHARAAGAAVVVKNKIVVAGGRATSGEKAVLVRKVDVYEEGSGWSSLSDPMPAPADHLAAVTDGRYGYFLGGRNLQPTKNFRDVRRFDGNDNSWKRIQSLPHARGDFGAAMVDKRLIVIAGGETGGGIDSKPQIYNLRTGSWTSSWTDLPPQAIPRHGAAVAAVGFMVYTIGGAIAQGHIASTVSMEALNLSDAIDASNPWAEAPEMALGVQQAPAALDQQNRLCVVGGLTEEGSASRKVQCYSSGLGLWSDAADLPAEVNHAMAVYYNGKLLVLGGFETVNGSTTVVSRKTYQFDGKSWSRWDNLPTPRAAGAAVVVDKKLIIVGGRTTINGETLDVPETDVFDGDHHWHKGKDFPRPGDHLAAATDGRTYGYFIGGRSIKSSENHKELWRYDPVQDAWQQLASMPLPRGGISAGIVGNTIVVAGGEDPDSVNRTVYAYNIRWDSWLVTGPLRTPRHGAAVGVIGSTVYVAGGGTQPNHKVTTNSVERLSP